MAEISQIKKIIFQLRRATTEEWKLHEDVIPHEGEPCYDLDLGILKIGDGKTPYKDLKSISGTSISDDGLSIVVDNLQSDMSVLRDLVGDISVQDQIRDAFANVSYEIDSDELQNILDTILDN